MRYLLMIYTPESHDASMDADEMGALMTAYDDFTTRLEQAGGLVACQRLQPVETATSVRIRDGRVSHTDGPFAETKEQLGGFYLIEAPDLDAALDWARQVPSAPHGTIEVRPIWDMPGGPQA
jgi:hypothetical protein